MIIEIEYYKGDVLLSGKARSRAVIERQFEEIEAVYDRDADNFIELLRVRFGWEVIRADVLPDLTYDRDTGKIYWREKP